jgi:formylglycine-generating enzyme required for sulfatase activity
MPARARLALALAAVALVAATAVSGDRLPAGPSALDRERVVVPAGWFVMGDEHGAADERPARRVWVGGFAIDRYEVTNQQYERFADATGRSAPAHWPGGRFPPGTALLPVVGVGWQDACDYCAWAGGRLPTEAEWEKACRSSDGRAYPWGAGWDPALANAGPIGLEDPELAWALVGSAPLVPGALGLRPVGSYPAGTSPYGVSDLVGNAAEWVADVYNWSGYADWPDRDPMGSGPPWNHSVRGSAWLGPSSDVAVASRCSERNSSHSYDDPRVGFRCAATLPPDRPRLSRA